MSAAQARLLHKYRLLRSRHGAAEQLQSEVDQLWEVLHYVERGQQP